MANKCLIMYESMTGNTEKVGMTFKKVFEKKGWEVTTYKVDKRSDPANLPFKFEDYDFLCIGTPVIENRPSMHMIRVLANHPDSVIFGGARSSERIRKMRAKSSGREGPPPAGGPGVPPGGFPPGQGIPGMGGGPPTSFGIATAYGPGPHRSIVFVTYSGAPPESELSLQILQDLLYLLQIKVVGRFSCRGTEPRHHSVDNIASNWYHDSTEEAADLIARYNKNPDDPDFKNLTEKDLQYLKDAVADKLPAPYRPAPAAPGGAIPGTEAYYGGKRPNDRDLLKAEIFIEEVIDEKVPTTSLFVCLA